MKRWNFKYGKKFKQWSDEAFNAGKESEAMKRLTLHRKRFIASLHRFKCPDLPTHNLRVYLVSLTNSYLFKFSILSAKETAKPNVRLHLFCSLEEIVKITDFSLPPVTHIWATASDLLYTFHPKKGSKYIYFVLKNILSKN